MRRSASSKIVKGKCHEMFKSRLQSRHWSCCLSARLVQQAALLFKALPRCVRGCDAPNLLKRFVVSLVAFVGLIVPVILTMAVMAAPPPAHQDAPHFPGCERNLAYASASVAAMQARIKSLSGVDKQKYAQRRGSIF